jgi:hypothetical protein
VRARVVVRERETETMIVNGRDDAGGCHGERTEIAREGRPSQQVG